jgi:hypothetical protein
MTVARRDELNASFQQLYTLLLDSKDIIVKATDPSDLAYKGAVLDFVSNLVSRIAPFPSSLPTLTRLSLVPTQFHSRRHARAPSRSLGYTSILV